MRDTVFEIYDRQGSFAIDKEEERFVIYVADTVEVAGWPVTRKQMKEIADFICATLLEVGNGTQDESL